MSDILNYLINYFIKNMNNKKINKINKIKKVLFVFYKYSVFDFKIHYINVMNDIHFVDNKNINTFEYIESDTFYRNIDFILCKDKNIKRNTINKCYDYFISQFKIFKSNRYNFIVLLYFI